MSDFYCPYWNCPLGQVTDAEQEQCIRLGKTCDVCMEDAEDEDYGEEP